MVALVTGGSSGIGLEYARQLAAMGYDLILVANRDDELSDAAARLRETFPVKVRALFQDLAEPDSADLLYDWCRQQEILPDIVINNAGMYFFKELTTADLDRVQAMINLHVSTVTRMSILFGQAMKERGSGYILIVSSMAARIPVPGLAVYSASKAYLKSFGRSLSYELGPGGVGVTTVCPAAIATPLYQLSGQQMSKGLKLKLIRTPEWLVRCSLRAMFRRRRVVSPGFMNIWLPAVIALLPGPLIARIWAKVK